jgi:DNA-binding response OmpR family regulator
MYRRILIVEDEPTLRRVIARNLTERPDLMLLDINLPDHTGWDVLRTLRSRGVEVPTVVVSAVRVGQNRIDEFRPLAYLPKPFPLEALLRIVEGVCRPTESNGAVAAQLGDE